MTSNIVLRPATISMLMLLAKATMILLAALGITQSMQRASAGARHLVWLGTLATLLPVPAPPAGAPIPLRILPATSAATSVGAPAVSDHTRSQSMKLEKSTP